MRPWVLHPSEASPHVPLSTDLDILVSDVLASLQIEIDRHSEPVRKKRLRYNQPPGTCTGQEIPRYIYHNSMGECLRRSYEDSWKDYRCKHVVSKWAARIILQFSTSQLADSLEAAEDVKERGNKRERDVIDNTWMRLRTVYDILQGTESAERRRAGAADMSKLSAHAHQIEAAKAIAENLWSLHMSEDIQVDVSNKKNCMTSLETNPS